MKHFLVICLAALAMFGCNQAGEQTADATQETAKPAPKPEPPAQKTTVSPELAAQLAKAELADGTEDKVVGKCASCALHMDGKPEHSVAMADYELHMCSDACAKNYSEDGESKLLALEIAGE